MHRVPNSAGTQAPRLQCPPQACDAHMHVLDRRYAFSGTMVDGATAQDYRLLQQRLGTERAVVVTPRTVGTDNRVTLDAIQQLGADRARGVAVLHPGVNEQTLSELHDGGIRGIRFTLYTPEHAVTSFDMVAPLAHQVHAFGWHLQLHWTADQIVAHEALLNDLPCPLVFDHLARLPVPQGAAHPAFEVVARLMDEGRAWVKLSGAYLDSRVGRAGGYADLTAVAQAFVRRVPTRLVWGSDWPHTTERDKPDDAELLDLLATWAGRADLIEQILVHNPAALYGFDSPKT